jgi:hypothetical protein
MIIHGKLMTRVERIESNLYKPSLRALSESSRVYTSMSRLIFEHIIVFMNDSFIIRTETELSLTESNRVEFTNNWTHLTPLYNTITYQTCSQKALGDNKYLRRLRCTSFRKFLSK